MQVIMPREANLLYPSVAEQLDETIWQVNPIEPEEEAHIATTHLQERHLVQQSLFERRPRLCVKAQQRLLHEELHSPLSSTFADYHLYPAREEHSG